MFEFLKYYHKSHLVKARYDVLKYLSEVVCVCVCVCVCRLGQGIDGRVQITHLKDGFSKDFKKLYTVGQLVAAKVLKYVHRINVKS